MALALNIFRTITKVVTTSLEEVYIAPTGYTGVVLLAQAANITDNSADITFIHRRLTEGTTINTEILKKHPISGNDSSGLLFGKLVLESGDKLVVSASSASTIKFIASILETLN